MGRQLLLRRGTLKPAPVAAAGHALPTTNLSRRWRADSIAQTDNTAVATWANLAGGVDLTQATGASQPTYRTGRQNGKSAVAWPTSGNSSYVSASTFATLAQPFTMVGVCKPQDIGNMELAHWGNAEMYIQSGKWGVFAGSGFASTPAPVAATWYVFTAVFNGSTSAIYVNGTSVGTGSTSSGSGLSSTLNLGRHASNGSLNWRGDIGEFLVYSEAADANKRAQIHTYAQDYWGISVADYTP